MSQGCVAPDVLTTAAADVEKIGANVHAAHLAAARSVAEAPAPPTRSR